MRRFTRTLFSGLAILALFLGSGRVEAGRSPDRPAGTERASIAPPLVPIGPVATRNPFEGPWGTAPFFFEANLGQAPSQARFLVRGRGYGLALTQDGALLRMEGAPRSKELESADLCDPEVARRYRTDPPKDLEIPQSVVRMRLVDGNPDAEIVGLDPLVHRTNYFRGNDPAKWVTDVPNFARVRLASVWSGIDLVFYGREGELEYDFVVRPGADPAQIRIAYEGADEIRLDGRGDVVIRTANGEMRQRRPLVYQETGGERREIAAAYVVGANEVSVDLACYDPKKDLVVDPVIAYSTYVAGTVTTLPPINEFDDRGTGVAVDSSGVYVAGLTRFSDFPTQNAYQSSPAGEREVFVSKLDPTLSTLLFSTYVGGTGADYAWDLDTDASGAVYVLGETYSVDFPKVAALTGPGVTDTHFGNNFLLKLSGTGNSLVFSTFISEDRTGAGSVKFDGAYVYAAASQTAGAAPVTPGAWDKLCTGCSAKVFAIKLSPSGGLVECTYVHGANLNDLIALDVAGGSVYVGSRGYGTTTPNAWSADPRDLFITKLDSSLRARQAATYFGGTNGDFDVLWALDATLDAVVITGRTSAFDFPLINAFDSEKAPNTFDAFVAKLDPALTTVQFSTFLGGGGLDAALDVAVDVAGFIHVVGKTESTDFPLMNPFQDTLAGGALYPDGFVTRLTPSGALSFSSFIGGALKDSADAVAVDGSGLPVLTGYAYAGFPTTGGSLNPNGPGGPAPFVTRLGYSGAQVTVTAVVPAAGSIAGGTSVTITGTNFGSGAAVLFGGNPASAVVVVDATTITCVTPAHPIGPADVTVVNSGGQYGTKAGGFLYIGGPIQVTGISPPYGTIAGGTVVTVSGQNIAPGVTVKLDTAPCAVLSVVGTTSLTCRTTAHAAGFVNVTATNVDLQSSTLAGGFEYVHGVRGDANGSFLITAADIFFLVNNLFAFGPSPASVCLGDANGSGAVTASDIFFLVNYLYSNGPLPAPSCP
jgi:hypothetical protein